MSKIAVLVVVIVVAAVVVAVVVVIAVVAVVVVIAAVVVAAAVVLVRPPWPQLTIKTDDSQRSVGTPSNVCFLFALRADCRISRHKEFFLSDPSTRRRNGGSSLRLVQTNFLD